MACDAKVGSVLDRVLAVVLVHVLLIPPHAHSVEAGKSKSLSHMA